MKRESKSWKEKLEESHGLPRVVSVREKVSRKWSSGSVVIPAPMEIDGMMRKVPRGRLTTINEIRAALAARHKATMCCPITAGLFAWIAAHASHEATAAGRKRVTPYWRTLKAGGELNEKYPGGIGNHKKLLEGEGHKVVRKGNKIFVAGYESRLAGL